MEESKVTQAALWWHRFRNRKKVGNKSLGFSNKGKGPKSFLIILPDHSTEADLASRFILSMKNALGPYRAKQIKILGNSVVGNMLEINKFKDFDFYDHKSGIQKTVEYYEDVLKSGYYFF